MEEGGNVIAMTRAEGASISLEPGGQLELSGSPFRTARAPGDQSARRTPPQRPGLFSKKS